MSLLWAFSKPPLELSPTRRARRSALRLSSPLVFTAVLSPWRRGTALPWAVEYSLAKFLKKRTEECTGLLAFTHKLERNPRQEKRPGCLTAPPACCMRAAVPSTPPTPPRPPPRISSFRENIYQQYHRVETWQSQNKRIAFPLRPPRKWRDAWPRIPPLCLSDVGQPPGGDCSGSG
ncbi:hypothetical protein SKAU_G00013470 [Synaphobranchus kaupii]|uniref:Uncharacterized protein n=1 Tax=Synaphobranchus kaupii TaxID=118154 RepID=A0A9Q1GAH5_SYNKA|nr:hypothetical protein SKAU_G00013470 [Synaphobranchus kaupii]